jgi:hypothetical protein
MHVIIDDMSGCPEIDWVNNFIVSIVFIAIQIFRLATVTY